MLKPLFMLFLIAMGHHSLYSFFVYLDVSRLCTVSWPSTVAVEIVVKVSLHDVIFIISKSLSHRRFHRRQQEMDPCATFVVLVRVEKRRMWSLLKNKLMSPRQVSPANLLRHFTITLVPTDLPFLPSSFTGQPTKALVPAGSCQFTDEFSTAPLLKRWKVSPTSSVLRFGLPDPSQPLNLSTCACILAKADLPDYDGKLEEVVRPYTPITTNAQVGYFDLLVKDYGEKGRMSTHLCGLTEGSKVSFKHSDLNVKIQAPFPYKKISMLVGGAGITPMIQALHAILGDPVSDAEAAMLYGSRFSSDILGKDLLDFWENSDERLSVTHILSDEPEDSTWKGERGFISHELIQKLLPPPNSQDFIIFVCGPNPMYDAMCGPRSEKELSGLLKDMGYSKEQVYKF
jgi:cytochrome-b5 reductase